MVLLLSESDLNAAVSMKEITACLEAAFREQSQSHVLMPSRQVMKTEANTVVRIMSASIPASNALGVKLLLGTPSSRKPGRTYFVTMLFSTEDASLQAIIPAGRLTQLRTGAASGIATRYLARKNAKSLGILGAGVQGYGQLEGLAANINLESAQAFDLDPARLDSMVSRAKKELGLDLKKAASIDEIYANDVISTATPAVEPVLLGSKLAPGTHVNAIGSNAPNRREIDLAVLQKSRIFVDKLEQVIEEAGDVAIPLKSGEFKADQISGNLCDVITGKVKGRESESQVTLFKSVGIAIEDIAVARLAYDLAVKRGIGQEISL